MKNKLIIIIKKICHGKLEPIVSFLYENILINIQYIYFCLKWRIQSNKKPNKEQIEKVCQNITFIYKSFERQKMAKRLYKNIQSYYPGVKVIIADDSQKPLEIKGKNLEIVHLPFNSGLSYGLNRALEKVETPFVMRMDDDELLTLTSNIHKQLDFLLNHVEIDLVAFGVLSTPKCITPLKSSFQYYRQPMNYAPKPLKIPHLTQIDETHIVVGKPPNIFLARTEAIKKIGWDDNIRMIDHNEFFYRAAGNIVSVLDPTTAIFHYHNPFDRHYTKYRSDVQNDRIYISKKHRYY